MSGQSVCQGVVNVVLCRNNGELTKHIFSLVDIKLETMNAKMVLHLLISKTKRSYKFPERKTTRKHKGIYISLQFFEEIFTS